MPNKPTRLIGGAAALLIIWAVLVILIAGELNKNKAVQPNELIVEVTASECRWTFDYPQSGYSSGELVVPVGRPLRLTITSLDTTYTFTVPGLDLRSKARPNRWTPLMLTPKEIDDYPVVSSETCGEVAGGTAAIVRVVEPMAFQSWLVMQAPSLRPTLAVSLVEKGRELAEVSGCLGCHSIDGSEVAGPTLRGLYGTQRKLEDGSTVLAEDEYIRMAIREPGWQIAEDFPNIMPAAYTMLTDQEIQAVIAFVASLE